MRFLAVASLFFLVISIEGCGVGRDFQAIENSGTVTKHGFDIQGNATSCSVSRVYDYSFYCPDPSEEVEAFFNACAANGGVLVGCPCTSFCSDKFQ